MPLLKTSIDIVPHKDFNCPQRGSSLHLWLFYVWVEWWWKPPFFVWQWHWWRECVSDLRLGEAYPERGEREPKQLLVQPGCTPSIPSPLLHWTPPLYRLLPKWFRIDSKTNLLQQHFTHKPLSSAEQYRLQQDPDFCLVWTKSSVQEVGENEIGRHECNRGGCKQSRPGLFGS